MEEAGITVFPSPETLCEQNFMGNIDPDSAVLPINHSLS